MDTQASKELLELMYQGVLNGEPWVVEDAVRKAMLAGIDASRILNQCLIPAMAEVGRRFEIMEYFLPEMLISAKAMQAGLAVLRPALIKSGVKPVGKVMLGTVKGDLHDIGKNLVGMMLEGAGFEVVDIGIDAPAERFVAAAQDGVQLVGISALLSGTQPEVKNVLQAFDEAGLRKQLKVMVGGAPVTQQFADEVGADGYAPDASSAVREAKRLLGIC